MYTERIDPFNMHEYESIIADDIGECLERDIFRGIGLRDEYDNPVGAMIWCLQNIADDDNSSCMAYIIWVWCEEKDLPFLFEEYDRQAAAIGVIETSLELDAESSSHLAGGLEKLGFLLEKRESSSLGLTVKDVKVPHPGKDEQVFKRIHPLRELDELSFRRGMANCIYRGKRDVIEDLRTQPVEWYEGDVSCYIESDGVIEGFILAHRTISGRILIDLIVNVSRNSANELRDMLFYSYSNISVLYPEDNPVVFIRRDEASRKLASHFYPGRKGRDVLYGKRTYA